jgi:hypothetical protein
MNQAKAILEVEEYENSGLNLKLSYMVEDFVELVEKNEEEEMVSEEKETI